MSAEVASRPRVAGETTPESDRWVVLRPFDTVSVRDGRAFDAGVHTVARSTMPHPSTLGGAVGAAYGGNPDRLHGPVPVRWDARRGQWQPLFPTPLSVVCEESGPARAVSPACVSRGGGLVTDADHHDAEASAGLLTGDGDPVGGWLTATMLRTCLHGESLDDLRIVDDRLLWRFERHVGLVRRLDRTAVEGLLYSTEHLRLVDGVALATRCRSLPDREPAGTVRFGGEFRRAEVLVCSDRAAPVLPEPPGSFDDGRVLLYLVTPALFADGWRPALDALGDGVELVGAAVAGPAPVATAIADHRTGQVRGGRVVWSVQAGSVYFLRCADPVTFTRKWHGQLLPQMEDPLVTAGFGFALVGRW